MNQSDAMSPRPVFIIGAARSGTKYLRDLASVSTRVDAIPFDVNFLWRLGNESVPHCELSPSSLTSAKKNRIRRAMIRASRWQPGNVLLEKSVSNALRVRFVKAVFPEAKFVHLIRDGRSVIESVDRVWDLSTPFVYKLQKLRYYPWTNISYAAGIVADNLPWRRQQKRIWGVRYQGIHDDLRTMSRMEICAFQWVKCVRASLRDLRELPDEDVLTIRYESLVADPRVLEMYRGFLGLGDDESILRAYQQRTRTDTQQKWVERFQQIDHQAIGRIMNPLLTELGYEPIVQSSALNE